MAQNDPQVNFRCPAGLKKLLELSAKANERTLNAEIVHRLNSSIQMNEEVDTSGSAEEIKRYVKEAITEMIRSGHLTGNMEGS